MTIELINKERDRIRGEAQIEISWWSDYMIENPSEALVCGGLIDIPHEGDNYRLIGVIRRGEEPSYLNPQAYRLLKFIVETWRQKIRRLGLPSDDVFLSISSLYRSKNLQEVLNSPIEIGAHQAGAAIDFDTDGYYQGVNRDPVGSGNKLYDERYMDCLRETLIDLAEKGNCHLIIENTFLEGDNKVEEKPYCYHVCVSPDFKI